MHAKFIERVKWSTKSKNTFVLSKWKYSKIDIFAIVIAMTTNARMYYDVFVFWNVNSRRYTLHFWVINKLRSFLPVDHSDCSIFTSVIVNITRLDSESKKN